MPTRSLQTRILALLLTLVVVVQLGVFLVVNSVGSTTARESIGEDLVAGAHVYERVRAQEQARLVQAARLLLLDPPFRQASVGRDATALTAALEQYGRRIDADLLMLVRPDDTVAADTLDVSVGEPFLFPRLLSQARRDGEASAMVVVRGRLYQLVVAPIAVVSPYAWVAVGYPVNDALAHEIGKLVRLDVSFVSRLDGRRWRLHASTLDERARKDVLDDIASGRYAQRDADGNAAAGSDVAVTRVVALSAQTDDAVAVVLQQPLAAAMEPFRRLALQLGWVSLAAALVSILASLFIARNIAGPLRSLAAFARRMAGGDYAMLPWTQRADEIGELSNAFRALQEGLASREQRITNLAYRDTLTGLPNRTLFADRLDHALATAAREQAPLSVLLMDVDHFKYVNDTLGHAIGDMLLLEVADRVQGVARRESDTVARLGGDEFALLLPRSDAAAARRLADDVLRALEAPMTLDGHQVDVRASIGIATAPRDGAERSTLMRRADVAMYAAKRTNVGALPWDDSFDQHSRDRLMLLSDLRRAVDADELTLAYQPKVSLKDPAKQHAEALLRWLHPVRGFVPPSDFIPFAEQTGYIRQLTQWVLKHAIAQCATWRRDGHPMNVSINISARDLMDAELPDEVAALLATQGCAAQWITLEITETAILDDPARALDNLQRLHALGCRLAIDDYGIGYSSLAYLRRLPVDELKIDKSFVANMARDAGDAMIVRSTIDLAHNMGLSVVAEGVEDDAVLERLRELDCDVVQGYLLCQPIPAAAMTARLADARPPQRERKTAARLRLAAP